MNELWMMLPNLIWSLLRNKRHFYIGTNFIIYNEEQQHDNYVDYDNVDYDDKVDFDVNDNVDEKEKEEKEKKATLQ